MSNSSIMKEFYEFGKKMHAIGILAIVNLIIPFIGIVELIFIFLALGNIKRIINIHEFLLLELWIFIFNNRYSNCRIYINFHQCDN
ncbi:MAG: hypothetical protein ACTSUT_03755 [Promethearchaeota archaeon]